MPMRLADTDTGKTALLDGRRGIVINDDSTNSPEQQGLVQLIGTSLYDMLEEKELSTGTSLVCSDLHWCHSQLCMFLITLYQKLPMKFP